MSIKKIIEKIENKNIRFIIVFFSIFCIAFLRNIIEHVSKENSIYVSNDYMITIGTYFFHFNFFWFAVFFALVLLGYPLKVGQLII